LPNWWLHQWYKDKSTAVMITDISEHIPEDFSSGSRIWIYQASRTFFMSEALDMEPMLQAFVQSWNSHGSPVKGYANLFFGRFIIIMADESRVQVGGCSTDSSVRLVKAIESKYKVDMFDRQMLAFIVKDKIEVIPLSQLPYALERGFITEETIYFDNTVSNKEELLSRWITPLKQSWLSRYLVPLT
jgi:hypothetical protein